MNSIANFPNSQVNPKDRLHSLQQAERVFVTDGGLETTLVFHEGWELPEFAAFPLLDTPSGRLVLTKYYERYIQIAQRHKSGFILESATWRASPNWGQKIGYSNAELINMNKRAVDMLADLRLQFETEDMPMLISGCIGPADDGYQPAEQMSISAARAYHQLQARAFKEAGADMISAVTMTYPQEAIGIAMAAADVGLPCVISFTVELDGHLPIGMSLPGAICWVDEAVDIPPLYYMINCAHPDHFSHAVESKLAWTHRIGGVRANASRLSHAELDESEVLDDGNPAEFGDLYAQLIDALPNLRVIGGCCGTDHRHVEAAAHACAAGGWLRQSGTTSG